MRAQEINRQISENFRSIREKIKKACEKTGRDPAAVDIMAVTKYYDPSRISAMLDSTDIKIVGESRVQDAAEKWGTRLAGRRPGISLHMIGHLQKNKAKKAAEIFDAIDSLDSIETAAVVDRKMSELGRKMPVLIQIKLTKSESQHGIDPSETEEFLSELRKFPRLLPRGYMAIAPMETDTEKLRPFFAFVKKIYDRDFPEPETFEGVKNHLSLGMSSDFETAVEEGSNLPRIGGLLFKGAEK